MKQALLAALALAPLALAPLGGACTSTYHSARFVPAPLEVPLLAEGDQAGQARALLSVRGIRRAAKGRPTEVEIKLRVENMGTQPISIEGTQWELVDSDLNAFGPVRLEPPQETAIGPDEKRTFLAYFPVAPDKRIDDYSLGGFNLRLVIGLGERVISTGVAFERAASVDGYYAPFYYPDPFYGPSHFHFGATIGTFSED